MSKSTPAPTAGRQPLTPEAREQVLNAEVAKAARDGWAVQSVGGGQAVMSKAKRIGFLLNLILVLVTGGLWLIWILYRALNRKTKTLVITVDAFGKVSRS